MDYFFFAVPARQNADAQHAGPPGRDVVPDGIAYDDAILLTLNAEPLLARQEEVRLGLAVQLPLSLHHNRLRADINSLERGVDERPIAGLWQGVRESARVVQDTEHLDGAGQWPGAWHDLPEEFAMSAVDGLVLLCRQLVTGFALGEADDELLRWNRRGGAVGDRR